MIKSRKAIVLADGGALWDFSTSGAKRLDYNVVPGLVAAALKAQVRATDFTITKESSLLFFAGTDAGQNLVERLADVWNVLQLPVSTCRYGRIPGEDEPEGNARGTWQFRFHAMIAFHIGILAASKPASRDSSEAPVLVTLSPDLHLVPALAAARRYRVETFGAWFQDGLPEHAGHFFARNRVPFLSLSTETALVSQRTEPTDALVALMEGKTM